MFSGKTEELIRRLRRARIAGQDVRIFKPSTDQRYADENVVTHRGDELMAIPIGSAAELLHVVGEASVVGIDEAQFFGDDLPSVVETLAEQGKRIVISGLDMDYQGRPFDPMPALLAVAEYITKVHAICAQCGNLATHSYRLVPDGQRVLLGAADAYEARCRYCFRMGEVLPFGKTRRVVKRAPDEEQLRFFAGR